MSGGRARQLPLALRYPPDQRLETYVGAPDGVTGQLRAWAEGRSPDWLYLAGPPGVGKTHLALAAAAATGESAQVIADVTPPAHDVGARPSPAA